MSGRRRWGIALAVLLALLVVGGAVRWWLSRAPAPARAAAAAPSAVELTAGDEAVATRTELARTLEVSGGLKAVSSALVKARVAAEVRELRVREGDSVRAGQKLGRLDDTEFQLRLRQAQDQAGAAQAQLEIAERTLANNRALVAQGFISQTALETSVSSAASATATLNAARAAADLARKAVGDSEIVAPITGMVAQRFVQPGERVGVDARLLEIVDLSRLELETAVAPEDAAPLRVGQSALLDIDGATAPVPARVARISPSTQAGTRAVLAYLELDGTPGLRQGLFARGRVVLERSSALVVPASALRADRAQPYVIVIDGGRAVYRPVQVGRRGRALLDGAPAGALPEPVVELLAGLQPGEVVLRGTVGVLREGTPVRRANASAAAPPPVAASAAALPGGARAAAAVR